jgi:hypothetical protein
MTIESMQQDVKQATVKRPKVSLAFLRIVLVVHAALVVMQPIMAGYYLSGEADAMNWHSPIGSSLWMWSMIQFVVAMLYWRPGGGRLWPVLASVALLFAELTQMILGFSQTLAVHIPLGTAIVISVLLFAAWSFRSSARRGRHPEVVR